MEIARKKIQIKEMSHLLQFLLKELRLLNEACRGASVGPVVVDAGAVVVGVGLLPVPLLSVPLFPPWPVFVVGEVLCGKG